MKHMWSEEEIQTLIEGQSGGSTLSDIVDSQGNKRFIEGDGNPVSLTGITPIYYKWILSGAYLTVIYVGKIANNTTIEANQKMIDFTLPKWILNKIIPLTTAGTLDYKSMLLYKDDESRLSKAQKFVKNETGLEIINQTSGAINADCNFIFKFDLVIDYE